MKKEELAARLLAAFLDELDEQLRAWDAELLALEQGDAANPDPARIRALFRVAHTLKGAARAANVPLVERVLHTVEALLASVRDRTQTIGPNEVALLLRTGDALTDAAQRLRAGRPLDDAPLAVLSAELAGGARPARAAPQEPEPAPPPDGGGPPRAEPPVAVPEQAIRLQAGKLDPLAALLGELTALAGQGALRAGEVEELDATLARWLPAWRRAARRARRGATGPEAEAIAALLVDTEQMLARVSREVAQLGAASGRDSRALTAVARELTGRVGDLRMRPVADVVEGLPRAVRDVAAAVQKDVRLELRGTHIEADRAVLDGIREALLHLVRNAVDHGIEPGHVRRALAKPEIGLVQVTAALMGDRLLVTISDDGRGIDAAAVRARLARTGRLATGDDRQLARAMLEGGFTTRDEASPISGRGVGLDVARAAVESLGGSLDVRWQEGAGTTFTLECPISLARIRAVVVAVGGQHFAVPTAHIDRLARVPRAALARMDGRNVLPRQGAGDAVSGDANPIPVHALAGLLGPPFPDPVPADPLPTVIVRAGDDAVALVVDAVLEERELVLRTLPGGHTVSPHVAGAATLPGGRVALVLSAASLAAAGLAASGDVDLAGAATREGAAARRHSILVVDDSITTRTLEQSVLGGAGYDVVTAVDGIDALRQLDAHACDLVVSDVEMPRMDGFALCEAIRASAAWARLPVVLVTAQESDSDRMRGLAAGADAYVGKSTFDQQHLLDLVRQLIG